MFQNSRDQRHEPIPDQCCLFFSDRNVVMSAGNGGSKKTMPLFVDGYCTRRAQPEILNEGHFQK